MVTLRDVAREANVSVATVSRVLNGDGSRAVRPDSAAAVRAAARKLDYRPNRTARSLRRRQTEMLGIIVPHIVNPFFAGVIQAVERALQTTQWDLLIGDAQDDPDLESRRLQSLCARQVDGVLVVPCEGERSAKALASLGSLPLVQVDRRVPQMQGDWIGVHNGVGIQMAVRHLRDSGRTELCFVGGSDETMPGSDRVAGYREALADAPRSAERVAIGDYKVEWGMEAGRRLLARGLPVDAVVCGNDLIALGVVRALLDGGVRVPADVAITGFDDIEFAGLAGPPLTTVRQPIARLGELAVDLLRDRIREPQAPYRDVRLSPQLVVRASSGGPVQG